VYYEVLFFPYQEIANWIMSRSEGRVRQETLDFYFHKEGFKGPCVIIVKRSRKWNILGVSACYPDPETKEIKYGVTVVHKDYRGRGIGSELMLMKLEELAARGYSYKTVIASDNPASYRMAEKCGLAKVDEKKLIRHEGDKEVEYTAQTYIQAADRGK
jgi:GNAT superfamily N-acetyltransferase